MTVYFYHTQDLNYIQREWKAGRFPSHLLYGASQLPSEGIDVVMHRFTRTDKSRLWRMIDVARKVLFCRERYDVIYATKFNGLEIIIMLRALGLFRKPIILWHHQPVIRSKGFLRNTLSRLFYRGMDHLFFFSDNILRQSLATGKVRAERTQQCPWGCDLRFYDNLMKTTPVSHSGFISTGKERRDMPTLVSAFSECPDQHLELITATNCCGVDYEQMFRTSQLPQNITLTLNKSMWIPELARRIWPSEAICICCEETNYTVGLTTLVEALAFGLPVIISRNPNQPFDASAEGCGISVPYGDRDGWVNAIRHIADNAEAAREMGRKGRALAENTYNIEHCAHVVAEAIRKVTGRQ